MTNVRLLKQSAVETILQEIKKKKWKWGEASSRLMVSREEMLLMAAGRVDEFPLERLLDMIDVLTPGHSRTTVNDSMMIDSQYDTEDEELAAASYAKGYESVNDPSFNSDVREKLTEIATIEDEVSHVVFDRQTRITELHPRNPRNQQASLGTAQAAGRLLDKPVMVRDDRKADDSRVGRQGQPKQHYNYNDDRPDKLAVAVERKRSKKN